MSETESRLPMGENPEHCGETAGQCVCTKPAGHVENGEAAHLCGDPKCGGSWTGIHGEDTFAIVILPGFGADPGMVRLPDLLRLLLGEDR